MSSSSEPLALRVRALVQRMEELYLDTGPVGPGWHSLADVIAGGAPLEEMLDAQTLGTPGLDRRGQAAYLIGTVCYRLTRVAAAFHLTGEDVPVLTPETVAVSIERYEWEYEGETGTSNRLLVRLPETVEFFAGDRAARLARMGQDIEAVATGLIERLVRETALGAAAQFRLAADSVASGFQFSGRDLGCEPQALEDAVAVIKAEGSRLRNPQTHFAEIALCDPAHPEIVLIAETFRMRGGCCRYYTADGGEYCSTCVLRKPADREEILRNYLRRKLEAAA